MFAHVIIALFMSFVAIEARGKAVPERPPCECYPDRMSGEVHYRGQKMYDSYTDYDLQKVVEVHHDRLGTDKVVVDLENEMRYRIKSDGSCSARPINVGNYAQCLPAGASKSEEDSESISFSYDIDSTRVKKTLDKNTCLPLRVTKTMGRRTLGLTFVRGSTDFSNRIMDVDIAGCEGSKRYKH